MAIHQRLQDLEDENFLLLEEIKKQKLLNEALIERHKLQDIILEKVLVGYYIFLHGKFLSINRIAASYTGYPADELIGRNSSFLVHPEDKEEVRSNARSMLCGIRKSPYEFRIITKKGDILWIVEAVTPILFNGAPAILGNFMDVTKRRIEEQELMKSENLYRTIFETTGTMTMISDDDMTILMLNSEYEKMAGIRKEDWEGKKKWTELIDKRDLPRMIEYNKLRRANPQAAPRVYEYRMVDSQGRIRNILLTVSMIPGTKKHVSSSMDITGLKEAEKQIVNKSEELLELNAALKVLLKQREDDRRELEGTLLLNIKELVLPYIEKIKCSGFDKNRLVYVDLLATNLENILSPFARIISAKYMNLSPKEIEVANLIKEGKSSKEIADLLNVASTCVDVHRYHIRKKLGLNGKVVNLRTYLSNLSS